MKDFEIKQMADQRWFYYYQHKNEKGETLVIELSKVECDYTDKNSIPAQWYKLGWINRKIPTYWSINTYVKTDNGTLGICNPQKNGEIVFTWILEATEPSKERLLNEVVRRFNAR